MGKTKNEFSALPDCIFCGANNWRFYVRGDNKHFSCQTCFCVLSMGEALNKIKVMEDDPMDAISKVMELIDSICSDLTDPALIDFFFALQVEMATRIKNIYEKTKEKA